jgi:hypothetical protein
VSRLSPRQHNFDTAHSMSKVVEWHLALVSA